MPPDCPPTKKKAVETSYTKIYRFEHVPVGGYGEELVGH